MLLREGHEPIYLWQNPEQEADWRFTYDREGTKRVPGTYRQTSQEHAIRLVSDPLYRRSLTPLRDAVTDEVLVPEPIAAEPAHVLPISDAMRESLIGNVPLFAFPLQGQGNLFDPARPAAVITNHDRKLRGGSQAQLEQGRRRPFLCRQVLRQPAARALLIDRFDCRAIS